MLKRLRKFWRDHVFSADHDWELKVDLATTKRTKCAEDYGMEFFVIESSDDERLQQLRRDFPRQSRSFCRDIDAGCLMLVLGDGTTTMGYYFAARQDFFDREQYRLTFPAGQGRVYAFNFYVDPKYRRKPVARILLSEGFVWLKHNGYCELVAICRSTQKALFRLYRSFGLRPTERAINAYRVLHRPVSVWTTKRG